MEKMDTVAGGYNMLPLGAYRIAIVAVKKKKRQSICIAQHFIGTHTRTHTYPIHVQE